MKKFHLSGIALLISGIALSGCAPKQTWSPELEKAREAYQAAANDPVVTSLAAAELELAKKQLKVAEDASDFFKDLEVISHEAALAHLKAQQAQQVARAQAAKKDLKLAQAGSLPSAAPAAIPGTNSPILAAATPIQHKGSMQGGSSEPELMKSGLMESGSMATESMTETQLIAQQLAALSTQLNQLQTRIASGALQGNTDQIQLPQITATEDEPALGAARPALQGTEVTLSIDTTTEQEPEPEIEAELVMVSGARLHEELRAMNAKRSDRGMSLTLGERYFESGSARLWNGRAARHLDNIAAVLVENPDLVLEIEAHTDNTGTAEQKDDLTSDRSIAIKSALVLRGVNASRISATGFGDSAPLADNNTPLGKLQNRRVEIVFPNVAK